LLVLRGAVLVLALHAVRSSASRAAFVALLFFASLLFRGVLFPLLALGLSFAVFSSGEIERRFVLLFDAMLALAVVLAAAPMLHPPPAPPDPRDPAAMVAYYQRRHNVYEGRFWALRWSRLEGQAAGEGHLALAGFDWELGRRAQARKVLAKVTLHPSSDAARARAEAQLAAWDREARE
jgi:hypothetical protein